VTAVTRDGGGEARLSKRSPRLWQRLTVSQSRIYHRPGWAAALERSPAASPRAFEVPETLCFVPEGRRGGLGLSPWETGTPAPFLPADLGVSISPVVAEH